MINITLEPDMSIEPGRQWIVLDETLEGVALAILLLGESNLVQRDDKVYVAHTADVDEKIREVINVLADIRFKSPNIVQLGLAVDYPLPLMSEPL